MATAPAQMVDSLASLSVDAELSPPISADEDGEQPEPTSVPKAKAKKKRKRKATAATSTPAAPATPPEFSNVLISRSKHLKYISSYHGQWLHLPPGLCDLMLEYNDEARVDYRKILSEERRALTAILVEARAHKDKATERHSAKQPARIDYGANTASSIGPSIAEYAASIDSKLPAPVDRSAIYNVMEVRRLVDAAGDLIVRATSGMTAAELNALNDPLDGAGGLLHTPIASPITRTSAVSAVRQNRLRAMAVSHIAQAFRVDEIATSVVLMQSATAWDDIAQRVLRAEPTHVDANLVMYYQQRIPSRTLCASTSPHILDAVVAATSMASGHLPALYRSRGVLHLYRQDFVAAIRDFNDGLRIVKLTTGRRSAPRTETRPRGSGKKRGGGKRNEGSKPNNGDVEDHDEDLDDLFDVGHAPGDDVGRQLLFSRGMAYFLWATSAIEQAALAAYGLKVPSDGLSNEGGELSIEGAGFTLAKGARGVYDEQAKPDEAKRFQAAFATGTELRETVDFRLRQSIRDHERFQAHFPVFEAPPGTIHYDPKQEADELAGAARATAIDRSISFRGRRLVHARALTGRTQASRPREDGLNPDPALFTTYHPMLGESVFTQLLAHLLLGDFERAVRLHYRAARVMSGLDTIIEGRPFFLLGRSLSQSEYHEIFERLSSTWLVERAEAGIPLPHGDDEADYAAQGPLSALAHIATFFTVEYEAKLYAHYTDSQTSTEEVKTAHPEAQRLLALLDGKSGTGKPAPPPKSHGMTPHTTARAEIALTWLRAACVAPLEEQEPRRPPTTASSSVGGSGSAGASASYDGTGKGKGRAMD